MGKGLPPTVPEVPAKWRVPSWGVSTLTYVEGSFRAGRLSLVLRLPLVHLFSKEVVLSDPELRLGRPRLVRLSADQQAEAVELLARLLLDAARRQKRRRSRPEGTLRRAVPNTPRRRGS
jgi:hypothetical protein